MITTYKSVVVAMLAAFFSLCWTPSTQAQLYAIDFFEGTFNFEADESLNVKFTDSLSNQNIISFYRKLESSKHQDLIHALMTYRTKHELNDWLFYQLVRRTAESLSPKKENYQRYTLYKWFLMNKAGYDAKIAIGSNQIIFYIKNEEDVSDIPFFIIDQKKYVCLNYHDYEKVFKKENTYIPVPIKIDGAKDAFSYKVTRMPDFKPSEYYDKAIAFNYNHKSYHFNLKVTNEVTSVFNNYPIVDYQTYFNIPLSKETYDSFIPSLKQNVQKMSVKKGVDYLMRFTRYAFLYEDDETAMGKEKRFSPEQTLLNKQSDCDDRAALFFFLVKEIYDLPMIALLYPTHITMAVQFDKPVGDAIYYNGKAYSICEPTPQKQNLKIGELSSNLKNESYQIVYAYEPKLAKGYPRF